jgi:FkbM family methyltransferase
VATAPVRDNCECFKSQFKEDEVLSRYFAGKSCGVYLEVGAFDGVSNSNTWYFEQIGWSGVLVEPNPDLAEACRMRRPKSLVVECAVVGDRKQSRMQFHRTEGNLELSSRAVDEHRKRWLRQQKVSTVISVLEVQGRTIDDILDVAKIKKVDFVTIDVEGFEFEALQGFSIARFDPDVVIVERNTVLLDARILEYFGKHGYEYARTTGSNDWFEKRKSAKRRRQGLLTRLSSIRTSQPLRQRVALLLEKVGVLSGALRLKSWVTGIVGRIGQLRFGSAKSLGTRHYRTDLWRFVWTKSTRWLGWPACMTLVKPLLGGIRMGRGLPQPGRVLVAYYGQGLGDLVVFLPILRALLAADFKLRPVIVMPSLAKETVRRLVGDPPEIVFYDHSRGWRYTWTFFSELQKLCLSSVVDFTVDSDLWQWEAACHLLMAPRVVGFVDRPGIRSYYDATLPSRQDKYIGNSLALLLEEATGIVPKETDLGFLLSNDEAERVRGFVSGNGLSWKKVIAMFPTTGRCDNGTDGKTWPYFGELIVELCQKSDSMDTLIVVFGEARHREYIEALVPTRYRKQVLVECNLSVFEVAALIRLVAAVITPNSGFLHIACQLGLKTVTFPQSTSQVWLPDKQSAHVVLCAECDRKGQCMARPPLQRNCYQRISVGRVADALRTLTASDENVSQ